MSTPTVFIRTNAHLYLKVPRAKKASWKTASLLAYRTTLLIVWSFLALPGVILNAPIFILASIMSRKKAKGEFFLYCTSMYSLRVLRVRRGIGCINSKNRRSRCSGDLESSGFTHCRSNSLRNIRCHCDHRCHESECLDADSAMDTCLDSHHSANNELRCIKIRGSRNGHYEVGDAMNSNRLPANFFVQVTSPSHNCVVPWSTKTTG